MDYKKVKDLMIDCSDEGLLGTGAFVASTRKGFQMTSSKQTQVVVKTILLNNKECEGNIAYFYQKYFTFLQKQMECPYLVKAISMYKTEKNYYFSFQKFKLNLSQLKSSHEIILNLLECCANGLKLLELSGCIHGNLKPSNIFYHEREQRFKLADHYGFKWLQGSQKDEFKEVFLEVASRNLQDEDSFNYLSPEVITDSKRYSIKSDIYALGKICFHVAHKPNQMQSSHQQTTKLQSVIMSTQMSTLLGRMIEVDCDKRIDLTQLINEIGQMKLTSEQAQNQVKTPILIQGDQRVSFRQQFIHSDDQNTNMRSRAQFYYIVVDILVGQLYQLKLLEISEVYLNYLIFCCHLTIVQSYKSCFEQNKSSQILSQVKNEYDEYLSFFHKVLEGFSIYVNDLELQQQVTPQRQDYASWYQKINILLRQCYIKLPEETLISDAIALIKNDIVEKNSIRRAKLSDNLQVDTVRALNLILLLNKLEYFQTNNLNPKMQVNYKKILDYIQNFTNLEELIQS